MRSQKRVQAIDQSAFDRPAKSSPTGIGTGIRTLSWLTASLLPICEQGDFKTITQQHFPERLSSISATGLCMGLGMGLGTSLSPSLNTSWFC